MDADGKPRSAKELGKWVKQWYKKKHYKQAKVAELTHMSVSSISRICCGTKTLTIDEAKILSNITGKPITFFSAGCPDIDIMSGEMPENTKVNNETNMVREREVVAEVEKGMEMLSLAEKEEVLKFVHFLQFSHTGVK